MPLTTEDYSCRVAAQWPSDPTAAKVKAPELRVDYEPLGPVEPTKAAFKGKGKGPAKRKHDETNDKDEEEMDGGSDGDGSGSDSQ